MRPATGQKPPKPAVPEGFEGGTGALGKLLDWPTGTKTGTPVGELDLAKLRARGITEAWARAEAENYRAVDAFNPPDPDTGKGNPTAARRAAWLDQLADRLAAQSDPSGSGGGAPTDRGAPNKPPGTQDEPARPRELSDAEKWADVERDEQRIAAEEEGIDAAVNDDARRIADGHGWDDHKHEFPELTSKEAYAEHVSDVIETRPPSGRPTADARRLGR